MTRSNAPWLDKLELLEKQGVIDDPSHPNPLVIGWAHGPGHFPEMDNDHYAPWCGIGMAGVMHDVGMDSAIPNNPAAAISWLECGEPCDAKPGAIVVFGRVGGNHVSCIKSVMGDKLECVGCNQNHAIKTSVYGLNNVKGIRWPNGAQPMNAPDPSKSRYSDLLQRCQVQPQWQARIDRDATTIVRNRARYKVVEKQTGVPWAFIGSLHMRESSNNFKTHLHNGDPLTARTYHEPAGRPAEGEPPFSWEESAIDALEYEGFTGKDDWTLENICERAEVYNGLGYRRMGVPSPYLWSGTNNYVRGKYVADGQYSSSTVDSQTGVIPVYLRAMDLAHEAVIREGSRKLRMLQKVRYGMHGLITAVIGLFSVDNFGYFKDWFGVASGQIKPAHVIIIGVGVALVWALINWLDNLMVQDAKAGDYHPSESPMPVELSKEATNVTVTTSVSV